MGATSESAHVIESSKQPHVKLEVKVFMVAMFIKYELKLSINAQDFRADGKKGALYFLGCFENGGVLYNGTTGTHACVAVTKDDQVTVMVQTDRNLSIYEIPHDLLTDMRDALRMVYKDNS